MSARWSRPASRRSRCRSRCARPASGCSRGSRTRPEHPGPPIARVIIGVGPGTAATRAWALLGLLGGPGHRVGFFPPPGALRCAGGPTWGALSGEPVAADVWSAVAEVPRGRLGQTADLVLVAPATADLI